MDKPMKFRVTSTNEDILNKDYSDFPNLTVTHYRTDSEIFAYDVAILEIHSLEELKKYYEYCEAPLIVDFDGASIAEDPDNIDGHIEIYIIIENKLIKIDNGKFMKTIVYTIVGILALVAALFTLWNTNAVFNDVVKPTIDSTYYQGHTMLIYTKGTSVSECHSPTCKKCYQIYD